MDEKRASWNESHQEGCTELRLCDGTECLLRKLSRPVSASCWFELTILPPNCSCFACKYHLPQACNKLAVVCYYLLTRNCSSAVPKHAHLHELASWSHLHVESETWAHADSRHVDMYTWITPLHSWTQQPTGHRLFSNIKEKSTNPSIGKNKLTP